LIGAAGIYFVKKKKQASVMMGDANQINKKEKEKLVHHTKLVEEFDIERPKT
jgi:hypothetical protein